MHHKLLLVDDDDDCRLITRHLLDRAGYEVIEASDGLRGYERVLDDEPGMIITDWDMPRLNGLDLIRRVRSAKLAWYPYIVLVTASENAELGLDTGADDFLSKPIREDQLLPRVRAGERIVTLQSRLNEQNQQLNRANHRLAQLATTDPLSGLLNRRAFFDTAEIEWRRCQRYGMPLSCLMLDIDHFKQINDTHGHSTGDAVIVALARMLKSRLRETDLICRYGGEEFCVWLTNTPLPHAERVAEELCAAVGRLIVPEIGPEPQITISIGVAARVADMPSERTLIDHADQALLIAKQTGRNRTVCFVRGQETTAGERSEFAIEVHRATPAATNSEPLPTGLVRAFRAALSLRDPQLGRQIDRRLELCRELGMAVGLEGVDQRNLEWSARLADMGWLTLTETRPADGGVNSLFAETRRKRALEATLEILHAGGGDQHLVKLIRLRDQWFDGSRGDPSGTEIPLGSRLLSLITAFIELRDSAEEGPLGSSSATAAAIDSLRLRAGQQFDPALVARLALMFAAGTSITDSFLVASLH